MRISDWSSDVCSSDLSSRQGEAAATDRRVTDQPHEPRPGCNRLENHTIRRPCHSRRQGSGGGGFGPQRPRLARLPRRRAGHTPFARAAGRSEEHTSELQSLMRISYAVFCLKKKNTAENINLCIYIHYTSTLIQTI